MVAVTGSWRAQHSGRQITALQWGTGYNPIHATRTGEGRNIAPDGTSVLVNPSLTTGDYSTDNPEGYGYTSEDETSTLWGYGTETGTADRQPWEDNHDLESGYTEIPSSGTPFPSWGPYPQGVPGGTLIRSEDHGAEATYTAKQQMKESIPNGWENKQTSEINNAGISDESQYTMQTSMIQRDKTRSGSQSSGTASQYDQPIHSRIVAMIEKKWSDDPARRNAMEPKSQDMIVRPFFLRQAGTGRRQDMRVNEVVFNSPRNRRPPDNPYTGETSGANDAAQYGYAESDLSWGY